MSMRHLPLAMLLSLSCSGCAVVSVGSAAVSVASAGIRVGATVVETTVDVAAAGIKGIVGGADAAE